MIDSKNKLTYSLIITGPPYGTQKALSAYHFANALLHKKHILKTIFFYQEGVLNGNKFIFMDSNELNLNEAWQQIAKKSGCKIQICGSASLRRGVISKEQSLLSNIYNLADNFTITGLISFAEAILNSDRTIQF
ncbi:sulfurtransferase complex subunit TusD [Candidatus Providencia siddallii]|uniref:Sulfurtransferase TusD n=1 Tax=Candidatus Providencia siddallii TaxID=1715285 RepID=A0ABP1CDC2_9GAMM